MLNQSLLEYIYDEPINTTIRQLTAYNLAQLKIEPKTSYIFLDRTNVTTIKATYDLLLCHNTTSNLSELLKYNLTGTTTTTIRQLTTYNPAMIQR